MTHKNLTERMSEIDETDARYTYHILLNNLGWKLDRTFELNSGLRVYRLPTGASIDVYSDGSWARYCARGAMLTAQGRDFVTLQAEMEGLH